jgi:hypothetical protein
MSEEQLVEAINKKRDEMIKIGMSKGLHSEETISCSQELDNLLNEYNRFMSESKQFKTLDHFYELLVTLHKSTYKVLQLGCRFYFSYFQH